MNPEETYQQALSILEEAHNFELDLLSRDDIGMEDLQKMAAITKFREELERIRETIIEKRLRTSYANKQ